MTIDPANTTVVVGMSGGVDSSVSALLLKRCGFHVIGLFMRNWEEVNEEEICCAAQDYEDVAQVCEEIGIAHYSINLSQAYWDRIFSRFLNDLKAGSTPNPDVLCNREIKFDLFLEKAKKLGGDFLATGHYCRIKRKEGRTYLLRGADEQKDQSYFLHSVQEDKLAHVLFPIGHLSKEQVRRIAFDEGLITAKKKDSTGICFIGKRPFKRFISRYIPPEPGPFETPEGIVVGEHEGAAYYTIGQRKGLGIGGPGEPWFVVGKDMQRNAVIVVQGKEHPSLYNSSCTASQASWVTSPPLPPFHCTAKVRYRQADVPCTITELADSRVFVQFAHPVKAITPKQSVVFYDGEVCLGGASIDEERA